MKFFKNLLKKVETKEKTEENAVENTDSKEYVKLKDEFDRDLMLEKDVWIKDFLKPALQKNWNNLEVLYSIVLDAFNNDIFAEVKDTTMRIYNMDKDKERGTNFLGIYYANNKMFNEAKSIYKKYMEEEKPSEIIFSNYGIVLEKEEKQAESQKYFWKALEINPNMQNPLNKVLEFSKAKSDEEYYKNLYKISTLPVSWRAKLVKANYEIKLGNMETALVDIEKALEESKYNSEAMTTALAIYGNNKRYDEIDKNVLSHFDPLKHGPYATSNVLKYLKIAERYTDALEILKYVSSFDWNEFTNDYIKYEEEFIEMKKNFESYDVTGSNKVFLTSKPIWFYNFNDPNWALNSAVRTKPGLLILPFTNIGEVSTDLPEKLSVAVPLFLNDKLHYDSDLQYQVAITHNDREIIIPKTNYDTEYIKFIKTQNPDLDYILSGNIFSKWNEKENTYELEVYVYDTNASTKTTLLRENINENTMIDMFPRLLNNLNSFFNRLIGAQMLENSDIENILSKPDRLEFLLNLDKNNYNRAWSYNKYLYNAINAVVETKEDDTRLELVSLLYQIKQLHPQLLEKVRPIIYNLLRSGYLGTAKAKKLLPIIFNIYSDEKNYNDFMETIGTEKSEYIDWINKFLDYIPNE